MKYIGDIKTDSIEEMVTTYGISIDLDPTDSYSVAKSVYAACEKLIPQSLIGIFTELGKRNEFEEDILQHMMFNTYMVSLKKKNEFIESNYNECKKTVEELEETKQFKNVRDISNYKYILNRKIGDYFNLEKAMEENKGFNRKNTKIQQVKVHTSVAPFIFFTVVNYDFHQDYLESKLPFSRVLIEKLNLYSLFLERKEFGQKIISNHLFEREYNIQLFLSIQREINRKATKRNFNNRDLVFKVLSLLSLLPNTQGRVKYVKAFLMVKELLTLSVNEHGDTYGVVSDFLLTDELKEFNWADKVSNIILQLTLFTIPIMESLHYFLTTESKINNYNINQIIPPLPLHEDDIDMSDLSVFCDYRNEIQDKFNGFCVEEVILSCNIDDKSIEDDKTLDIFDKILHRFETVDRHITMVIDNAKDKILKGK